MEQQTQARQIPDEQLLWKSHAILWLMGFMFLFGLVVPFLTLLALPVGITLLFLDQKWMGRNVKLIPWVLGSSLGLFALWWLITPHVETSTRGVIVDNYGVVWGLRILLSMLTMFLLARPLNRSIDEFVASAAPQIKTKFRMELLFLLTILFGSYLIGRGADWIARQLGTCNLPTLPDLAQNWDDEHRQGIGSAVMRTGDLGCDRNLRHQNYGPQEDWWMDKETALDAYMRRVDIQVYNEELGKMGDLDIDHHLSVYQTAPDLEEFARILGRAGTLVQIPALRTPPDFAGMACEKDESYTFFDCRVIIVRGRIVSHLWLLGRRFPDDQVLGLANAVIIETDERVLQYIATRP